MGCGSEKEGLWWVNKSVPSLPVEHDGNMGSTESLHLHDAVNAHVIEKKCFITQGRKPPLVTPHVWT